jgi:hypothetical protein
MTVRTPPSVSSKIANAKGKMGSEILRDQFLYWEVMINVLGMRCKSCVKTACGPEI